MAETQDNLKRPPVVVVVGHVDHGKTSLLDFIRKTNVVAKEAGAITQSVGAYEISHNNQRITFIDTPGHEAFSKMRVRGAQVADVAILVVAADEGVKPQTKEAINAINEAKTPFVVAITKIDKPSADIEKVKNELTANNIFLEGYGGNISYQGISSKTGEGINELLDLILLATEMEDLKYNPMNAGAGVILEVKMDNRRGNTATVILKDGKLAKGDLIATPTAKGKIKILEDFLGKPQKELIPSSPAVILGLESLPLVGETFKAGDLSEEELKNASVQKKERVRIEPSGKKKIVKLILKADLSGSLEALRDILNNLPLKDDEELIIISESVGGISDGDVKDAIATGAAIVGFRVKENKAAENLARTQNIRIIIDEIIYKLVEKVQELFKEESGEEIKGTLEILAIFNSKGSKQTIGGKVISGQIKNKARIEIQRDGKAIGAGKILNLQQMKKDAPVVSEGGECGLIFESDIEIQKGDTLINK